MAIGGGWDNRPNTSVTSRMSVCGEVVSRLEVDFVSREIRCYRADGSWFPYIQEP